MAKSISEPREDYKPHAPRIVEVKVAKEYIGAIIGPGGKIIQEMQKETGAIINIEEVDEVGIVNIASPNQESIEAALARIEEITYEPEIGEVFDAVVRTVMPYGVFVDFKGKSGLLHVSEFAWERVNNAEDVYSEGDIVQVKLVDIDERSGKLRMSRKALLPRPEGMPEEEERPRRPFGRGGGGGGRGRNDRRGGGGGGRGGRGGGGGRGRR